MSNTSYFGSIAAGLKTLATGMKITWKEYFFNLIPIAEFFGEHPPDMIGRSLVVLSIDGNNPHLGHLHSLFCWYLCAAKGKNKSFTQFFSKNCPVQSETLVAHHSERHFLEFERSFARLPQAILPNPLWAKRANSWLKTCFQSPFLQEKRFSKADCKQRAISKIIQRMIFDDWNYFRFTSAQMCADAHWRATAPKQHPASIDFYIYCEVSQGRCPRTPHHLL